VVSAIPFDISSTAVTEDRLTLLVGRAGADHVAVRPSHRMYPDARDAWDGNWLTARIEVQAGGFRGEVDANLRCEDFVGFREQLTRIIDARSGEATFETMEEWLVAHVVGDGQGHWQAVCELHDAAGTGNRLSFMITVEDEEAMRAIRDALDRIVAAFPITV
jgi:hypothetical protein